MTVEVRLIDAEVLRVGPDEVLIIKGDFGSDQQFQVDLCSKLIALGLTERALVLNTGAAVVEMAVVKKDAST